MQDNSDVLLFSCHVEFNVGEILVYNTQSVVKTIVTPDWGYIAVFYMIPNLNFIVFILSACVDLITACMLSTVASGIPTIASRNKSWRVDLQR